MPKHINKIEDDPTQKTLSLLTTQPSKLVSKTKLPKIQLELTSIPEMKEKEVSSPRKPINLKKNLSFERGEIRLNVMSPKSNSPSSVRQKKMTSDSERSLILNKLNSKLNNNELKPIEEFYEYSKDKNFSHREIYNKVVSSYVNDIKRGNSVDLNLVDFLAMDKLRVMYMNVFKSEKSPEKEKLNCIRLNRLKSPNSKSMKIKKSKSKSIYKEKINFLSSILNCEKYNLNE